MNPIIPENPIYCEYCGEEIVDENYWESKYDGELYPVHNHCSSDFVAEKIAMIEIMAGKLSIFLEQGKLGDLEDFAGRCHVSLAIVMDYCEEKWIELLLSRYGSSA